MASFFFTYVYMQGAARNSYMIYPYRIETYEERKFENKLALFMDRQDYVGTIKFSTHNQSN